MNEIYPAILALISLIVIYFGGFFHGRKRLKELKEEIEIQKKITDQDKKVEKEREVIDEVYDKAREHLGNKYTFNPGVRATPQSGSIPTPKATLFTVGGKIQGMGKRKPAKASKPYP